MSASPGVISRLVNPLPAPVVPVCTRFAPTNRSFAFAVAAGPLLLVALLPTVPMLASNGLAVSNPLYSAMRMSGQIAAVVNVTVTLFPLAAADAMFFA